MTAAQKQARGSLAAASHGLRGFGLKELGSPILQIGPTGLGMLDVKQHQVLGVFSGVCEVGGLFKERQRDLLF